MYSQQELWGS